MNKKGSMELSVNSIVILVIAITLLGLILGFITTKMREVKITPPAQEAPPASSAEPVTVSSNPFALNSGKTTTIGVNVYNSHTAKLYNVTPVLSCTGAAAGNVVTFTVQNVDIKPAESYGFIGTLKTNIARDQYLCRMAVGGCTEENKATITSGVLSCAGNTYQSIGTKDFTLQVE